MPATRIEKDKEIAVLWIDQPGRMYNVISLDFFEEFEKCIDDLENDADVRAIVLTSGKESGFIAGADIEFFQKVTEPGEIESMNKDGNAMLDRMAASKKPIVAAIHGPALGGGLEVALACRYRICTDHPSTVLAQPEVQLGLLPGGGGTQRLPKLVGVQKSLEMMTTGKNIYPYPAKKMGLVDMVVNPYALIEAAKGAARKLLQKEFKRKDKRPLAQKALESTSPGRNMIYKKAREMARKKTLGNYPAPLKIIDCVEAAMEKTSQVGKDLEREGFVELMFTPQARQLINLFFAMTAKKKNPAPKKVKPVTKIGVLGAGLMGAGIAQVSANKGLDVLLKDMNYEALGKAEKGIWADLDRKVRRRAITRFERDRIFSRISSVIDDKTFSKADMVIEAVFEDIDLKHKVLAECEAATRDDCIFASNTSSLPITDIAAGAKRPELVVGMHYFSPVPKMPLLEIIETEKTADWVTATAFEVGIRQGKTVIVVKDCPGFYTTRILAPLMNEALEILAEGADISTLDRAMKEFGFPVGPVTLMDEVGIDVGAHVSEILAPMFKARGGEPSEVHKQIFEAGFHGRKNGKGFYQYATSGKQRGKKKEVNLEIYRFFGGPARKALPKEEMQERLSLMMINEALHCLREGILKSPEDGDLGAIMGLGFPPFLGGPFRYIDSTGADKMLDMFKKYEDKFGARFTPAELLKQKAEKNGRFYS